MQIKSTLAVVPKKPRILLEKRRHEKRRAQKLDMVDGLNGGVITVVLEMVIII